MLLLADVLVPLGGIGRDEIPHELLCLIQVHVHNLDSVPLQHPAALVEGLGFAGVDPFDAELDDFRPALPTDNFPAGSLDSAPDLSLMAKARAAFHGPYGLGINQLFKGFGGAEYIVAILTGYTAEEKEEAGTTLYQNTTFPGGYIAMNPPLFGEDVEYADGHSNDLHAESEDVAAFLMWAAEPKLVVRKRVGFIAVVFLSILSVLMYYTNKRIWAPVKGKPKV